ncbi:MAG: TetR/AcrR family transcriptional regulator [Thermoleophilaceae bacterium]
MAASERASRPPRRSARRRPDQIPGGRHGLAPAEVAESQCNRILTAMTEAVGRNGFQNARVADVIGHAGVSRKTFYEHFEDKERCFVAAYRQVLDRVLSLTLDAFEAEADWIDRLRAGLTALLDALAHDPAVARLCFVEVLAAGPRAIAVRNDAMRGFTCLFDPTGLGSHGDRAALVRLGMVGGLSEILYRDISGGATAQLHRRVPDLMYMSVLPFAGPDAAAREIERAPARGVAARAWPPL